MRKNIFLLLSLFSVLNKGYSQQLTYTYPTTFAKYSKDTKTVSLYYGVIENFDESMITAEHEIESNPHQITYLNQGGIEKIENVRDLKDKREMNYNYDNLGNITSRVDSSSIGFRTYTYKLYPADNKLEAYMDGTLGEVLLFDEQQNVISRKRYHYLSKEAAERAEQFQRNDPNFKSKSEYKDGVQINETKSFYENGLLIRREEFKNKELTSEDNYHYKAGKLYKVYYRYEGKPYKRITTYTYSHNRKEIITKSTRSSQNAALGKTIELFDDHGNKIKVYQIHSRHGQRNARVTEFRINKN